ncbi:MAG: hypothetical protein ABJL99_16930 [Aliishimia sp.]
MRHGLGFVARHGRWCLVLGLLAGLTLPEVASALKPWLPEMISGLLFLSALRIGPRAAIGGMQDIGQTLKIIGIYQFMAPMAALVIVWGLGVASSPWALALVLVLSAPSVTGSANFAILLGRDPAIAMRLMLVGTALFPLTAIPVLWLSPASDTILDVLMGAGLLMGVIFGAVGVAFAARFWVWRELTPETSSALDGASAILLGIVVVGLMSAVGPALWGTPIIFAAWLCFALTLNFGAQTLAARFMPVQDELRERTGVSIVAGNRNIALFLVALPEATTEMLLLFIGCYQVPMYLTPIVMRRIIAPDVVER